jgi:acetoin utilization deacetylase AcuC-like enzyme
MLAASTGSNTIRPAVIGIVRIRRKSSCARSRSILERFADCDLLLYQAGADPHVDDPLGGWLTTAQLRERDRRVFSGCRAAGLPVAWNLAGGYQSPLSKVIAIHDHTMLECLAAFVGEQSSGSQQ